ncbi:MAG: type II toxin-antitoxin system Phd/YefM family antitoxin [Lachnospiraceae bacterium]|nr:type II toxin-antitoxin system Phd/YefM family antitoxin [Lachnospiraceae bacterium]
MTAKTAQQDFPTLVDCVVKQGDTISIATDDGAAVLVSQDEWYGLLETLYLQSIPGMKESILEGKATPISECLDSVGWDIS